MIAAGVSCWERPPEGWRVRDASGRLCQPGRVGGEAEDWLAQGCR
jgi:hypothetical protein